MHTIHLQLTLSTCRLFMLNDLLFAARFTAKLLKIEMEFFRSRAYRVFRKLHFYLNNGIETQESRITQC